MSKGREEMCQLPWGWRHKIYSTSDQRLCSQTWLGFWGDDSVSQCMCSVGDERVANVQYCANFLKSPCGDLDYLSCNTIRYHSRYLRFSLQHGNDPKHAGRSWIHYMNKMPHKSIERPHLFIFESWSQCHNIKHLTIHCAKYLQKNGSF